MDGDDGKNGMRIPIYIIGAILSAVCMVALLGSCSESGQGQDRAAALAAKEYYDSLFAGGYACFVANTYRPDSIPASYRQQLEDNAKMLVARLNETHHGVREVQIADCVNDTAAGTANAMLVLCFNDSLNEEIVVPMVMHKDKWLMR